MKYENRSKVLKTAMIDHQRKNRGYIISGGCPKTLRFEDDLVFKYLHKID